jgi:hypothetical protein
MGTSVPPPGFAPAPAPEEPAPLPAPARARGGRTKLLAAVGGLAAVAIAAFLLIGGSGGGGGLGSPVAQAATISSGTAGYRVRMTFDMSAAGTPIVGSGSGVVDLRDHATSVSMAMNFGNDPQVAAVLGGSTMRLRMVMAANQIYVKLPALPSISSFTGGKPWVKVDLSKLSGIPGLSSIGSDPTMSDPSQMLQYLRSQSDVVLNEGHELVDGFETTHYQAEINLGDLIARLGGSAQQALSKLKQLLPSSDLPVDVWIDSAHLVRRISMTIDLGSQTGSSVRETVSEDLSDYGPQSPPALPTPNQVEDLSGLLPRG